MFDIYTLIGIVVKIFKNRYEYSYWEINNITAMTWTVKLFIYNLHDTFNETLRGDEKCAHEKN